MIHVIFTSDYEIHANGGGSSYRLMVEPTYRNMDLFEKYGAKLTIMADVAEILKFKEYKDQFGSDDYHYEEICAQLKNAVIRGHDVQLHLHPQYLSSHYSNGVWNIDNNSYVLKNESYESLLSLIKNGKDFLTNLLHQVNKKYKCNVFRAGGWQMQPSENIVNALVDNDFLIDSSVFKNGTRGGINHFDYSSAHDNLLPWLVDANDVCKFDQNGKLIEVPIYTEQRYLTSFISLNRIYRLSAQILNKLRVIKFVRNGKANSKYVAYNSQDKLEISYTSKFKSNSKRNVSRVFTKYPLKMDFNQCTGKQLIFGLENAEKKVENVNSDIPFVIIGHSKTFTKYNERILIPFLKFVKENSHRFRFSLFSDLDLRYLKTRGN